MLPAPRVRHTALPLAVLATASAVVLTGCSPDSGAKADQSASSSPSTEVSSPEPTPSPTTDSTVAVPGGVELSEQGGKLSYGDTATVIYEPSKGRGTVLELTVKGVRKGTLADFKGFILDSAYKRKASYYYADVRAKNVGQGDVGGVGVPLWGVNAANTLLPAVNFTTSFKPCPTKPLPKKFPKGATLDTCLVYLSPDHGSLEAVSYRPSQKFNPITWTGDFSTPKPTPKKKADKG